MAAITMRMFTHFRRVAECFKLYKGKGKRRQSVWLMDNDQSPITIVLGNVATGNVNGYLYLVKKSVNTEIPIRSQNISCRYILVKTISFEHLKVLGNFLNSCFHT